MAYEEYKVAGYGEKKDYDAPYHPDAYFDPAKKFANAGNPEAAALDVLKEEAVKANKVAKEFNKDPEESEATSPASETKKDK